MPKINYYLNNMPVYFIDNIYTPFIVGDDEPFHIKLIRQHFTKINFNKDDTCKESKYLLVGRDKDIVDMIEFLISRELATFHLRVYNDYGFRNTSKDIGNPQTEQYIKSTSKYWELILHKI